MCDFENGFILCSCEPIKETVKPKRKSKRNIELPKELGYRWTLSRFVGIIEEPLMEGSFEPPSKDLGKGLNDEWILLNLNLENCFDFEYIPLEGDNLIFKSNDKFKYLSFVFSDDKWVKNNYDPFSTILESYAQGKIEEKNNQLK